MRLALCAVVLLPAAAHAFDDAAITERCRQDWGEDFRMVAYCCEEQRKAGQRFDALKQEVNGDETTGRILDQCVNEWSLDYRMVIYCYEQQVAAREDLDANPDGVPKKIMAEIMDRCTADWKDDFRMLAYCRDQQVAAWRSLN